jgi:hypothetical protein
MKIISWISLLCLSTTCTLAQRISDELVMKHISYLSSDALLGRATSSEGERQAAAYIAQQFDAMGLLPMGSKEYYFDFTYRYNANIHDTSTFGIADKKGRNVIAFLDNHAPTTIVIGAHHDHLGLGQDKNSLDPNPIGKIHNGADDNASGVAGVIELARYFSNNGITEKHNFLFMTFSGEELGLIGSKKWCENPTIPLSTIHCMINMDMIGRLNDSTKKLMVYGVGTSDSWTNALEKANHYFALKFDSAGIGPSDQTSFYLKDIPAIHFFTGQHSDYHKPTDDAYKVNEKGEAKILEYIIDVIFHLENSVKMQFLKTKNSESMKMSFKVTLGIMPDYTFDGNGLRLDGVTDGKPAEKGGLQSGDILVKMGDSKIENIQDYMKLLQQFNKGDKVDVFILRNGYNASKAN